MRIVVPVRSRRRRWANRRIFNFNVSGGLVCTMQLCDACYSEASSDVYFVPYVVVCLFVGIAIQRVVFKVADGRVFGESRRASDGVCFGKRDGERKQTGARIDADGRSNETPNRFELRQRNDDVLARFAILRQRRGEFESGSVGRVSPKPDAWNLEHDGASTKPDVADAIDSRFFRKVHDGDVLSQDFFTRRTVLLRSHGGGFVAGDVESNRGGKRFGIIAVRRSIESVFRFAIVFTDSRVLSQMRALHAVRLLLQSDVQLSAV